MKEFLFKISPGFLKRIIRHNLNVRYKKKLRGKTVDEIFTDIYINNIWGNKLTPSGTGSTEPYTKEIIIQLPKLLKKYKINSILDLPCGDLSWIKLVDLGSIRYTGADIVEELIKLNSQKYASDRIQFKQLNIINDKLPAADLLLCRDCFVHLSNQQIIESIENISSQRFRYLLLTSFPAILENEDIITGEWRPLNMEIEPFNLEPIDFIEEKPPVDNPKLSSKRLILVDFKNKNVGI